MLAKPVTGWKKRFPSTTHYHNLLQKAITYLHNLWVEIYEKVPAGKEKSPPSTAGTFNCAVPFLCATFPALVCLVRSQKNPASVEVMLGQDFLSLTAAMVLFEFLLLSG